LFLNGDAGFPRLLDQAAFRHGAKARLALLVGSRILVRRDTLSASLEFFDSARNGQALKGLFDERIGNGVRPQKEVTLRS